MSIKVLGCPDKEFTPYVKRAVQYYSDCLLTKKMQDNLKIVIKFDKKIKDFGSAEIVGYNASKKAREFLIKNGYNVLFTHSCLHKNVPYMNDAFDNLRFDCECRKPKTGMLDKASKRIQISPLSIFYGDSDCDEECANNFGLFFFRIY